MVIPPLVGNPCHVYITPYSHVDDHPLLQGNHGEKFPPAADQKPHRSDEFQVSKFLIRSLLVTIWANVPTQKISADLAG